MWQKHPICTRLQDCILSAVLSKEWRHTELIGHSAQLLTLWMYNICVKNSIKLMNFHPAVRVRWKSYYILNVASGCICRFWSRYVSNEHRKILLALRYLNMHIHTRTHTQNIHTHLIIRRILTSFQLSLILCVLMFLFCLILCNLKIEFNSTFSLSYECI